MDLITRVYYEDTDAGGVVYHANYLHFYERARTEFLRELGFSQQVLLQDQIAFVVKKLAIDYQIPAKLDDLLTIRTEIVQLKGASIVFEQSIWREAVCLNRAQVVVAAVNLAEMKAMPIPKSVREAMATQLSTH